MFFALVARHLEPLSDFARVHGAAMTALGLFDMRARQCAGNADLLLGEVHVVSLEREPLGEPHAGSRQEKEERSCRVLELTTSRSAPKLVGYFEAASAVSTQSTRSE